MNKPTVCFVHGDALDLFRGANGPRFGGSETQVYQLAKVAASSGLFDTRLVADKDVAGVSFPGISFDWTVPPIRHGVPYVSRLINRARRRRPYRNIEHGVLLQTILGDYTTAVWRVAREMGLKFVYRMSCDADIDGSLYDPDRAASFHAAIKDADGVIAQTVEQQRRLQSELGITSTVVPSIVDLPREGPALGGSHVLWVGRGAPIKRPWIMIETARTLPQIQFVMLMPVEDRLFWRCIAQEAQRVPNLKIVPGVSYFEIDRYYREAALFANTSAIEGVPSVFLQAAAQGTPVVSLEIDPDGMLESEGFGRSASGDVDAFRSIIAEYMSRPDKIRESGQAGFDYVKRAHSPEAVGPIFNEFAKSVLQR